jgi:hypothetical protein
MPEGSSHRVFPEFLKRSLRARPKVSRNPGREAGNILQAARGRRSPPRRDETVSQRGPWGQRHQHRHGAPAVGHLERFASHHPLKVDTEVLPEFTDSDVAERYRSACHVAHGSTWADTDAFELLARCWP